MSAKKRSIFHWLMASMITVWGASGAAADLSDRESLEAFMDGAVEMALLEYDVPGATVSVVRDGEIILAKGYGYADAALTRPVDPNRTLFRVASISKMFTSISVMQLVEKSLLDLDADVNIYLEGTGVELPNEYGQAITLKHILTHRTGLEDGAFGLYSLDLSEPLAESLVHHMPKQVREPGTLPSYSNYSFAVAGLIVQNVSGVEFKDYVERNIYQPLGMSNSTFDEPLPENLAPDMVEGVRRIAGKYQAQSFEYHINLAPSASMTSTAADMAKFMIANLQHGRLGSQKILSGPTTDQMHSQLQASHADFPGMAHGFYEEDQNGYRFVGHGGATILFHSNMLLSLDSKTGIFMSFNGPSGAAAHRALMSRFIDRYFPAPALQALKVPTDFNERASRYTGNYRATRHNYTTLEKLRALGGGELKVVSHPSGTLVITGYPGGKTFRFVETDQHQFRRVDGDERVVFKSDASGNVTNLFVSDLPYRAWYRLSWWESNHVQWSFILFCLVVFAVVIAKGVVQCRLLFSLRGKELAVETVPLVMSLIYLIFGLGMINVFSDMIKLMTQGYPAVTQLLLALPLLGAMLTVVAGYFMVQNWRVSHATLFSRIRETLLVLLSVGFLCVLNYWNALGWNT